MANIKALNLNKFEFTPFSKKQLKILTATTNPNTSDKFIIVADGSIRAGKSVVMLTAFVLYTMDTFDQQNCAICGKSIGSLKRNILMPLQQILTTLGYKYILHRSENYLEIIKGSTVNYYFLFGAKSLVPLSRNANKIKSAKSEKVLEG